MNAAMNVAIDSQAATVTVISDERQVLRRSESVLRLLGGRTTVADEAARHRVELAEVERWLRRARIAVTRAMRGDTGPGTGNFVMLEDKPRHVTGVFFASGRLS